MASRLVHNDDDNDDDDDDDGDDDDGGGEDNDDHDDDKYDAVYSRRIRDETRKGGEDKGEKR